MEITVLRLLFYMEEEKEGEEEPEHLLSPQSSPSSDTIIAPSTVGASDKTRTAKTVLVGLRAGGGHGS